MDVGLEMMVVLVVDNHKITIMKNVKSHIKNYTQLFEFDLKFSVEATQGQIHWEEAKNIGMKDFFVFFWIKKVEKIDK